MVTRIAAYSASASYTLASIVVWVMAGKAAWITNTFFMSSGIGKSDATNNTAIGEMINLPIKTAMTSLLNFRVLNFTLKIAIPMKSMDRGVVILPKYLQVFIRKSGKAISKRISITANVKPINGGEKTLLIVSILMILAGTVFPSKLME